MLCENIADSLVIDFDSLAEVSVFFVALSTNASTIRIKTKRRRPAPTSINQLGGLAADQLQLFRQETLPLTLRFLEFLKTRQDNISLFLMSVCLDCRRRKSERLEGSQAD